MDTNFRHNGNYKDTMKIFNERWQANADSNKQVVEAKKQQQDFNKRLFNGRDVTSQPDRINMQVKNLREIQRENFRNKI